MLGVTFLSIAIQFVSSEYGPMIFVSVSFCLKITQTFKNVLVVDLIVSEALERGALRLIICCVGNLRLVH